MRMILVMLIWRSLAANGVLGNTKNPQKTVQVDSEMHNFGGQYRLRVCFNVAPGAFHKSRKREKGNKPQAINIGQRSIVTDEKKRRLCRKGSPPFYLFSCVAFMKRISDLEIQI